MNVAIYCRVSTDQQLRDEGSLKNQEQACRAYVDYKYKDKSPKVELYVDEAISAKNITDRPSMQRLIKDIHNDKVNAVIINKLDRAFRNVIDTLDFVKLTSHKNIIFHSLKEDIDTKSASGKMFLTVLAALAEMEREQTSERLKFSVREKAKRGIRSSGNVPYGYRLRPGGVIEDVPAEQEVVRKMFELYFETGSFSVVRDRINALGHTHTDRRQGGERDEGKFIAQTINNLIRNKFYINILECNKANVYLDQSTLPEDKRYYTMPGSWNPCVDEELFYKCQAIADKNKESRHNSITVSEITPLIFSGLIFCDCGKQMVGHTSRRPKSVKKYGTGEKWMYTYYRCKPCKRLLKSAKLEEVIDKLADDLLDKDNTILKDAYRNYEEEMQAYHKYNEDQLVKTIKNLNKATKEKEKIINVLTKIDDPGTIEQLNTKLKELSKLITGFNNGIEYLNSSKENKLAIDIFSDFVKMRVAEKSDFKNLSAKDKKQVVNALFSRITVKEDRVEAELKTSDVISLQFGQKKALSGQMGG
jgi:site-specific DNA recombinase